MNLKQYWDTGAIVGLAHAFIPFSIGLYAHREAGVVYYYRVGYVFGLRIFKIQFSIYDE